MQVLSWIRSWIKIIGEVRNWIRNNPEVKHWFRMHFKEQNGHFLWDDDSRECLNAFVRSVKKFFIY